MNAKSIVGMLGVSVCALVSFAQNSAGVAPANAKMIFHNLHQIAAAAEQYYLEKQASAVSIDDLVGPTKLIKRLVPVADEDYRTLVLKKGHPIVLTMPSGEKIAANAGRSDGCTYAFHKVRHGDTLESIVRELNVSTQQIQSLNPDMNLSELRSSDAVRVK
jgi:hypothetical protein